MLICWRDMDILQGNFFENKDLGIVKEVIPYQMPYLKKEVIAMFKHFKNKKNGK